MHEKKKYVIITPAYNESEFISKTIDSVIKQTILPAEWIIVDDSSTDKTSEIINFYTKSYPWLKYVKKNKSVAPFGANVVEVFYFGKNLITNNDYDFIVKLDADIDLIRSDYFEYQIKKFNEIKKLGISSGITYYIKNGKKILVDHPDWRTTGALKMYRKECFTEIGGIEPIFGWDGLDEYKAMYRGWQTRTFRDLEVLHLKKIVSIARENTPDYYIKKGLSYYQRGYPYEFIFIKSISLLLKLNVKYGFNLLRGYFIARLQHVKQFVSREEKKFIRRFQIKRISLRRIE